MRDRCVEQHSIDAQLHGCSHVTGRADSGVDDHWIIGIAILEILHADSQIVGVENALA